jgi:hypothetical protein
MGRSKVTVEGQPLAKDQFKLWITTNGMSDYCAHGEEPTRESGDDYFSSGQETELCDEAVGFLAGDARPDDDDEILEVTLQRISVRRGVPKGIEYQDA